MSTHTNEYQLMHPDTVTITISREAAKDLSERAGQWAVVSKPFADACRAALEGER